jgi:hypothetical protein
VFEEPARERLNSGAVRVEDLPGTPASRPAPVNSDQLDRAREARTGEVEPVPGHRVWAYGQAGEPTRPAAVTTIHVDASHMSGGAVVFRPKTC